MDKSALRSRMRTRRRALMPTARRLANGDVVRQLLARDLAGPVAVYLATPDELDLGDYISASLAAGRELVAPRWNGRSYDLARLRGLGADDLRRGPMGVLEPAAEDLVSPPSVRTWLVPGLAFTADGARLGYGGGWYDRLLAAADPASVRLGVAHRFQLVRELPEEAHDVRLTEVVVAKERHAISLDYERAAGDPVMGIDEAGRGPLVGGVYTAAVSVPLARAEELLHGDWRAINDSKKLTEARREALADIIRTTPGCTWAIASASAAEIDERNILRATHLAMKRAADALGGRQPFRILVDGLPVATLPGATNVVKGDAQSLLIAAASILAKTARDADCLRLEKLYPGYGFAKHKGYPTADHLAALAKLGPCPEHRRSFGPVAQLL